MTANKNIIPFDDIQDPQRFISMAKPLGFILDAKIKNKIRSGEFVRMYDIVYPDMKLTL